MATSNLPMTPDAIAGEFLQSHGRSLKDYAVRDYNQTSFLKSAMIAIADNYTLAECAKTPTGKRSLFNALRYAASTGLSLNPQEGKSALIAYKNKNGEYIVSYQVMKNGMIELALESGKVDFITADLVRENDKFDLVKTAEGDNYTYQPALKDRGEVIGFIAALKIKGGATHAKWMTVEEVQEVRDGYSAMFKHKPDDSPWTKSFNGMGIKTVMKSMLRSLSLSEAVDNATGADDFFEYDMKSIGVTAEQAQQKLDAPKSEPKKFNNDNGGSLL